MFFLVCLLNNYLGYITKLHHFKTKIAPYIGLIAQFRPENLTYHKKSDSSAFYYKTQISPITRIVKTIRIHHKNKPHQCSIF